MVQRFSGGREVAGRLALAQGRLAGISDIHGEGGECRGIGQLLTDARSDRLGELKELCHIVSLSELHLVSDEKRLQCFLRRLLGMKTDQII